ncbi:hypothetical protein SUGI_0891460 [Cryptomeria japonica]|nr:hypothetical protein SUGI_0891460 [Cryptomeria japonica]
MYGVVEVKLLHKATSHVVAMELKINELYRGNIIECEDIWNFQLEGIPYTTKYGKVSHLEIGDERLIHEAMKLLVVESAKSFAKDQRDEIFALQKGIYMDEGGVYFEPDGLIGKSMPEFVV